MHNRTVKFEPTWSIQLKTEEFVDGIVNAESIFKQYILHVNPQKDILCLTSYAQNYKLISPRQPPGFWYFCTILYNQKWP